MSENLPDNINTAEKRYKSDSLFGVFCVVSMWALMVVVSAGLVFTASVVAIRNNDAGPLLCPFLLALAFQLPFLHRTWSIRVSKEGLKLFRFVGQRTIPWRAIEDVVYSPITLQVTELRVNGKKIAIPQGPNIIAISSEIRANTRNRNTCHADHRATPSNILLERSIPQKYTQNVLTACLCVFIAGTAFSLGWLCAIAICLAVFWMPAWVALNVMGNRNRALHVRTTEHGLTVKTVVGTCHMQWKDLQLLEQDSEGAFFILKSGSRNFKLGSELSNYPALIKRIADESLPLKPKNDAVAQIEAQKDAQSVRHSANVIQTDQSFTILPSWATTKKD